MVVDMKNTKLSNTCPLPSRILPQKKRLMVEFVYIGGDNAK